MMKSFTAAMCISAILVSGCAEKDVRQFRVVDSASDTMLVLKGEQAAIGTIYDADIVIVGGSLSGLTAAFAACAAGRKTVLIEESSNIAACFADTSQYVDSWLQQRTGISPRISRFRQVIRDWYRISGRTQPVLESPMFSQLDDFSVEAFCFEMEAALAAVDTILASYQERGRLTVLTRHKTAEVITYGPRVASLNIVDLDERQVHQIHGWIYIDATETGELLPMAGVDFSIGFTRADSAAAYDVYYYEDTLAGVSDGLANERLLDEPPGNGGAYGTVAIAREPRRLSGWYRVTRDDIAADRSGGPRARFFDDSVGVGYSPMVVRRGTRQEIIPTLPFQIPLRSMIAKELTNFIAAGQAFGAGPSAASAFYAPSVQMPIGEAAGVVAEFCAGNNVSTHDLLENEELLRSLQRYLVERRNIPIYWYDNVRPDDQRFSRAQRMPFENPAFRGWPSMSFTPPDSL